VAGAAAHELKIGDAVFLRKENLQWHVVVKALSDKRGRHRIMAKDLIYAGHVAEQASNPLLLLQYWREAEQAIG